MRNMSPVKQEQDGSVLPQIIKKIPGAIPPPPKKSSQGFIDDLSSKQLFELLDLLQRQESILANKSFISKLPDKGEKILNFKKKIIKEIESKTQIEEAGRLLSRLNIASEGKAAMTELEWTGKYNNDTKKDKVVTLDSDDEEDPLKILAQPTGSGVHKKKIIKVAPEESLIKPSDLEEIKSFQSMDPSELQHVKYITSKVENVLEKKTFKPYKTTKSNVHDPEKEKLRKKDKHWEVTAATPPLTIHGTSKLLDLNESLKLQKEQELRLKEIRIKHAAERLANQIGKFASNVPLKNLENYRTNNENDSDSDSETENYAEVHDDEDDDKAGTVTFTVDSVEE